MNGHCENTRHEGCNENDYGNDGVDDKIEDHGERLNILSRNKATS